MKTCEWCGNDYTPLRRQRVSRWCSPKCCDDARNAMSRAERAERSALRECVNCGTSLAGRNADTKWCSLSCANDTSARRAAKRKARLKAKYGLTEADMQTMLVTQGGRCAICNSDDPKTPNGTWSVDHDHLTGAVRGLLCTRCNTGIGQLRDDPAILRAAADYLESRRAMAVS